jgi:hypothetical protein
MADEIGRPTSYSTVAELGPGSTLGVGMAALLTGTERYIGLDSVRQPAAGGNLRIFDELVTLLSERTPIPGYAEFPELRPILARLDFPNDILTEDRLAHSLDADRVSRLRRLVEAEEIEYFAPWDKQGLVAQGSIDLVLSQAVMEHVVDLGKTYSAMHAWLRPGGLISHQIDFRSHGTSSTWNGHWTYPGWLWRLVQADVINRQPLSVHLSAIEHAGFSVLAVERETADGIERRVLRPEWGWLSDDDLRCQSAFVQAVRP